MHNDNISQGILSPLFIGPPVIPNRQDYNSKQNSGVTLFSPTMKSLQL